MLDFIINSKLYKFGSIETIYLNDFIAKAHKKEKERGVEEMAVLKEIAILMENKFKENVVLQWKWGTKMSKQEETIFEKGDHGFEALKKCEKLELDVKKNNGYFL